MTNSLSASITGRRRRARHNVVAQVKYHRDPAWKTGSEAVHQVSGAAKTFDRNKQCVIVWDLETVPDLVGLPSRDCRVRANRSGQKALDRGHAREDHNRKGRGARAVVSAERIGRLK